MRGVDGTVTIELFPDVTIRTHTLRADENYSYGTATWSGREIGDSENTTHLAITVSPDGTTLGEFVTSKGTFILETLDHPPFHILSERPPESLPID
jgi:hypothetical protein